MKKDMKTVIHLRLPTMADYFRHRHPAPGAVAARRRGNAAGVHGGPGGSVMHLLVMHLPVIGLWCTDRTGCSHGGFVRG